MLAVVPAPVTVRVPAKVNLHLCVGARRSDGYHDLRTIFHALSITDEVLLAVADESGVTVTGDDIDSVPLDDRNLALRAVRALARHCGRSAEDSQVRLVIRKAIPVAGGMAGGSADAAAALVGAAALWRLDIGREELSRVAATLGSDVSFLLHGGTALGTGRGEQIVPVLSRHTFHWVLALDRGGLSTPVVFGELDRLRKNGKVSQTGEIEPVMEALASGNPAQLALLLGNDLQAPALSLRPDLRRTLRAGVAAGALAGLVSGSGPTCAFLCADHDTAISVAAELAGAGVCRTVRVASGGVVGARVISASDANPHPIPPQVHA
ncbi:MAG: 4-(cytidine 5'-diphospho)-2-C-methyl-D-erythritol kinase [Sciscionella sp.]